MRRLHRPALDNRTSNTLARLTAEVLPGGRYDGMSAMRWRRKPVAAFKSVRDALASMASGRQRCMYCEDSHGTDIDHFRPRAGFPTLTFHWPNLLLACAHCNSNQKRDRFPVDAAGDALLIDPTSEEPADHLALSPTTGELLGLTAKGSTTIDIFGLNDSSAPRRLRDGRRHALVEFKELLRGYNDLVDIDPAEAVLRKSAMQDHPFSAVLHWIVLAAQGPNGRIVLGEATFELVHRHRVFEWL